MNKKTIIAIIVVVSFVFTIFVLNGKNEASNNHWKRNPQPISPYSVIIAKAWWPVWDTFQIGVLQREKIEQSFKTIFLQEENHVLALDKFQKGMADAATLTIYEALLAASQGVPLKIVLLLGYTIGSEGVVAKESINSLRDLQGKRIGVEKGTGAHFIVLKMLEKAGLDQTEVQLIDLDLEKLQQAFLHNEVDAAAIYEPYMSNLARQGNGYIIFSSQEIPRAICDVLFVKDSIAREHPEVVDHWIEAWSDALNFKGDQPEEYLRTLSRLNRIPIPDIRGFFNGIFFTNLAENRIAFGTSDRPGYLLESLREMEDFMFREGIIQEKLSLQDLIESGGIQRFFQK